MFAEYRTWQKKNYRGRDGVLVGSDATQEWLLPWWYKNYIRHNSDPITWIDFGLSFDMRKWCKERGELIILRIADIFVASQEEISQEHYAPWEERFGPFFWKCRNAWFKKPAAFLQTPYERTIWIDCDCEVKGSLAPLFDFSNPIAMRLDLYPSSSGALLYNSGVVPYRWGLPCIEKWAELSFDCNQTFMGDQDILSEIIAKEKIEIRELPTRFHRFRTEPEDDALIIHWTGPHGKKAIEHKWVMERMEHGFG